MSDQKSLIDTSTSPAISLTMDIDPLDSLEDLFDTPPPPPLVQTDPPLFASSLSSDEPMRPNTPKASSAKTNSSFNDIPEGTSRMGDPTDACDETGLYDTLLVIQDIIKSQTELFNALTTRLNELTEHTKTRLAELAGLIEKTKKESEERKIGLKAYMEKAVEEAIRRVVKQDQGVVNSEGKGKGKDTKKGKESNQGKKRNRELEALSYDFFSSDKSENKPRPSSDENKSQTPFASGSFSPGQSLVPTSRSFSVNKKLTEVIDLTALDDDNEDEHEDEDIPVPLYPNPPTRLHRGPLYQSTETPRNTLHEPVKPSDPSRERDLISACTNAIEAGSSWNSNVKRARIGHSHAQAIEKGKGKEKGEIKIREKNKGIARSNHCRIVGKKQIGTLPDGRKDILYLIKQLGEPVSSATWIQEKDIDDFDTKNHMFMQDCDHEDPKSVSFRNKVAILPEAQVYWDKIGEKKVDDGASHGSGNNKPVVRHL
ncbi:hypothetical protein V866_008375 [Kwoniella sp. B9012]|uniref:Uncharacterized protein n=1 Tax=Kwoniella europaea PYCC6329 TaxID=1423913 RepID=A0AAX4KWM5_9TREE